MSKSASELLTEALKAQEENNAKIEALLKQTRDEDLVTAKRLIKTHGFTPTDLKPELKARGTARASTPRKSTRRKGK